jgi:hypothetical protein
MKKTLLISLMTACFILPSFAQSSAIKGDLTVYTPQGWIMKAKNAGDKTITFKFTWVTEGTNKAGEVVSTKTEESESLTIAPREEQQLFTAPQDPQKEITYVFKDIVITQYSEQTSGNSSQERMNRRMR